MEIALKSSNGDTASSVEVSDAAFGVPYNETLVYQIVTAYMSAGRAGTKSNRSRADVSGGGSKPWRQKGTGRARSGTSRSPIWRGGGVTFAARPRSFAKKVNRKMYRAALRSIFSELVRSGRFHVVDSFELEQVKTKLAVDRLKSLGLSDVLVITSGHDEQLALSVRNLRWAGLIDAMQVDPVSLLSYDQVLVTRAALELIEGRLLGLRG